MALLLTTAGAITVMALIVQWNLARGFRSYIELIDQEKLADMAREFSREYQIHGNWLWAKDGKVWRLMTRPAGRSGASPRSRAAFRQGPDRRPPRGEPGHKPSRIAGQDRLPPRGEPGGRGPRGGPPPPPPPQRPGGSGAKPVSHAASRLSLFDAQKTWVAGQTNKFADSAHQHTVESNGQIVGWLTIQPPDKIGAMREVNFLREQSRAFLIIALAMLVVTALLAYFLARQLTQPLTRLTQVVRQLAAGDYSARMAVSGRDEITALTTDVNTLANALQKNLTARQRWVMDISHELRTPLAILQGEIEAIRDGIRKADDKTIESLHTEALHLGKLVNDLHDLSMADAGALTYKFQPLDIAELISQCVTTFTLRFEQKDLSLVKDLPGNTAGIVYGDSQRLEQLICNLLENSRRYTTAGGQATISVAVNHKSVIIEITDTAPSIDAEQCEKLFERFYRADESRTRQTGGSGLGMAIAKSIVEAHEGHIQAKPSDIGGLAISIELPRYAQQ